MRRRLMPGVRLQWSRQEANELCSNCLQLVLLLLLTGISFWTNLGSRTFFVFGEFQCAFHHVNGSPQNCQAPREVLALESLHLMIVIRVEWGCAGYRCCATCFHFKADNVLEEAGSQGCWLSFVVSLLVTASALCILLSTAAQEIELGISEEEIFRWCSFAAPSTRSNTKIGRALIEIGRAWEPWFRRKHLVWRQKKKKGQLLCEKFGCVRSV